jgi:hypothetical protein
MTKYVVLNENTLGYMIKPNLMGVLHGSVLKGGHSELNGPVTLMPSDKLRPATQKDFDDYSVCSRGHLPEGYRYHCGMETFINSALRQLPKVSNDILAFDDTTVWIKE